MKKILLSIAAIACTLHLATAQTSGGPDAYGYTWRDSNDPNGPVYNWIDILPLVDAQEVKLLADDNTRGPFTIGFPFHFYWYDVSTFWVGSNGYIAFNNGLLASPFKTIPDVALPQNFIAAMESDLNFDDVGNPAKCWYWRNLTGDTLIVTYITVPFWQDPTITPPSYTGSNTFQIILSGVDSSITMQYAEQTGFTNVGPGDYMSIGIENNSGAVGLQHSHNVYPPINYAIKYYYPASTTFQVNDASCSYNDNSETGGLFICKSLVDSFQLKSEIKNTGNTNLNPFNVSSSVKNSLGVTYSSNAIVSDTLVAGQSQLITFPQAFLPTATGTYKYTTSTLLGGDATPSNNTRVQELVVIDSTTSNQWLSYDNGVANVTALSWQGGNGGAGVEFKPPYYPCKINSVRCYIVADPSLVGYSAMIFDDNGVNGTPNSLLDSQFVAAPITGSWNTTTLTTPIVVNSGSVWVAWYMGGPNVSLGTNSVAPISNRTYEILGNSWAIYRDREISDIMININISPTSFAGMSQNDATKFVSDVYPNPASDFVSVDYKLNQPITKAAYTLYNLQGQQVDERIITKNLNGEGTINIDVQKLTNGLYVCKLKLNDNEFSRRVNVVK